MTLPLSIDDVSYYNKAFVGDLIITPGKIYFFPHAKAERKESRAIDAASALGEHAGLIGVVIGLIVAVVSKELRTTNKSQLHKNGMWKAYDTNEELQSRLDTYVEALKQKQKPDDFSSSLPKPIRIASDEIVKIKTSFTGKVLIETRYDKHDFDIGFKRKKVLLEALTEGKFVGQ
jgi:hypothetical protein